mgnify:CR=1 FL=1
MIQRHVAVGTALFCAGLMVCSQMLAQEFTFDLDAVSKDLGRPLTQEDLDRLEEQGRVGMQIYDITINRTVKKTMRINILKEDGEYKAQIPAEVLFEANLRKEAQKIIADLPNGATFTDPAKLLPGSTMKVDVNMQTVQIVVPQAWQADYRLQLANPTQWDWGEPALILNYSGDYTQGFGEEYGSRGYGMIGTQLNLGAWRLVNHSNLTYDSTAQRSTRFEHASTYLTRLLPEWQARFTAGNLSTISLFDDSLQIVGVELRDDDNQHEPSEQAYIPEITGVADTPSIVTIRQGGRTLLVREVPAGPYRFTNLEGLGFGGTVEVSVRASDGSVRTYYVPFMSGLKQLNTGRWSWNLASGRLDEGNGDKPYLATFGVGYGLPLGFTLFGSALASEKYWYAQTGVSKDLSWAGALSLSLGYSDSTYPAYQQTGETVDLSWRKVFSETNSQVSVSYGRTLSGAPTTLTKVVGATSTVDPYLYADLKSRLSISMNQLFKSLSNSSLVGTYLREEYATGGTRQSLNASYMVPFSNGSTLSLSVQHTRGGYRAGADTEASTYVTLMYTIPLDRLFGDRVPPFTQLQTQMMHSDSGWDKYVNISGSVGKDSSLYYSVGVNSASSGTETYTAGMTLDSDHGRLGLNATKTDERTTVNFSAMGGVLAMRRGIFFARDITNSAVVVSLSDAEGFEVDSHRNVRGLFSDSVLVTDLSDYRRNEVRLNPDTIPANVSVSKFIETAIPADGAILDLSFKSVSGHQVLFTVKSAAGEAVPFASPALIEATDREDLPEGVFDEDGKVYFSAAPEKGELVTSWSENGRSHRCVAPYVLNLEGASKQAGIIRQSLVCKEE